MSFRSASGAGRQIWRFERPGSAEKKFLAKIQRNPLIGLVSDERIQGNPNKSNAHNQEFRAEMARDQENPNGPTGAALLPRAATSTQSKCKAP
jgi:hypothetical protein